MRDHSRAGTTLIEVILGVGLVFMLFGGLFLFYQSVVDVLSNTDLRTVGTAILGKEMEIVRNLPFDQVGTVGGIPSGVLPPVKIATTTTNRVFAIRTTVRNIDDPFDGTLGGTPNDTAPADYKLVELEATCTTCPSFVPLLLTAQIAPKNLESTSNSGSLFVNAFNAYGLPVSGASVHVVNTGTVPSIDLTDTTNQNGVLQLVGVPTSTNGYQITVTKTGYSTDKTYPLGDPANPNPKKPHLTVEAQKLTPASFSIDALGSLAVRTVDPTCAAVGSQPFSFHSATLIGENPDVLKFSTSSQTGADGLKTYPGVEWGTYTFSYGGVRDLLGTLPLSPESIVPGASSRFLFVLQPADPDSLLLTVKDGASGAPVAGTTIRLSKSGFSETKKTGEHLLEDSDWSGGAYSAEAGTDPETLPGTVTMATGAGGYSTTTVASLTSETLDFGSSTVTYKEIDWSPASQAPETGSGSLKFQVAANNDNATWDFTGPDGTSGTFYTSSSAPLASALDQNRYLRYRAYLSTVDQAVTPELRDVAIRFSGPCVPIGQALFQELSGGNYTAEVTAPGYSPVSVSVSVSGAWNEATVNLSP